MSNEQPAALDRQLDYWNRVGPEKPFSHPIGLTRLHEYLPADAAILDFGCGYGRGLQLLAGDGFRNLRGADPAPAMVTAARERCPGIPCDVLVDSPHVPAEDASFDAFLLISVLTCVPTNAGQQAIVDEAARLLKPGGILHISDLWLQSDARNQGRYARGLERYGIEGVFDLPEGVTVRHHTRAWIDTLTARFEPLALDEIDLVTMNGHRARGFQYFGRRHQA